MKREELKDLGVSKWDKLSAAVENGDKDASLRLISELKTQTEAGVGTYLDWIDMLLSRLAGELGEESLYQIMLDMSKSRRRPLDGVGTEGFSTDAQERLKVLAYLLTTMHGANIDITEDEEKFTIRFPCVTGGGLIERGQYGKTEKAYPWSHSKKDICYYCVHCITGFEMAYIEKRGHPAWIVSPPTKPGDPCIMYIYKDQKAIPEKYYESLGMYKDQVL